MRLVLNVACACAIMVFYLPIALAGSSAHTYDSLNRLVQTVITDGSKTTTITYQYDDAGNMTSFTTESETPITIDSFAADFGLTNCNGGCPADIDGDGDVDGKDLQNILTNF